MSIVGRIAPCGASVCASLVLALGVQASPYNITLVPPADTVCHDCTPPNGRPNPAPPANFNPLTASNQELQHYGFPPRPDTKKDPAGYAFWSKLVTMPAKRVIPKQRVTTIYNSPAIITSIAQPPHNFTNTPVGTGSSNWSGYADAVAADKHPFRAANTYVYGEFVVPVAQQAFGACTGGWDYSSFWVGIDGWGTPDVFQAGIEADAYCGGSTKNAFYSAWYEWYPYSEVQISAPEVQPGDAIYVYIWNTSRTVGNYYMLNVTQQVASSLQFAAPSGTSLHGNSVEWIAERPTVNGQLAALTNYVATPWYYVFAHTAAGHYYSPGLATGTTIYSINMLDNNSSQISYCGATPDSKMTYRDQNNGAWYWHGSDLWCFDTGSAF